MIATMQPHGSAPQSPMPAGWYPDPSGAPQQRYFDGTSWSVHTAAGHPALPAASAQRKWLPWGIAGLCALLLVALLVAWGMRPGRQGQPGQPGQRAQHAAAALYLEPLYLESPYLESPR